MQNLWSGFEAPNLSQLWHQKHRVVYHNVLPELDEADADGGQGRDGEEDEEEHCDLHVHPPRSATSTLHAGQGGLSTILGVPCPTATSTPCPSL